MDYELIGLSPEHLRPLYTGNSGTDSGIIAVSNALGAAQEACEKIAGEAAALKADKDLSPSGRLKKFRERERKFREPALSQLNSARALVESKVKDIERRISEPPEPDDEGLRRQRNIVAAIREMKPDERFELINRMDDEIAGAVLRNHPVALGMTANEQDLFRLAWRRTRFSTETDHLDRNRRALGYIERAIPIVTAYSEKKVGSINPVHLTSH